MRAAVLLLFFNFTVFASDWQVGTRRVLGESPDGVPAVELAFHRGDVTSKLTAVVFDSERHRLVVADSPLDQGLRLAGVARDAGALAGINASYFHADGRPLGLVVEDGQVVHQQERANLLSGIFHVTNGRMGLVRAGSFRMGKDVQQAIQAGPWLVEDGRPIGGLDTIKRARRSLIATDGRGNWALVATSALTLADTADLLAMAPLFGDDKAKSALNLDGGSSTALWAGFAGVSIPEFGVVRNFLLLTPKE
ncbi:MAG: phosphodiester glycosidase family protein [Terrimicrobiaceae bacterium]